MCKRAGSLKELDLENLPIEHALGILIASISTFLSKIERQLGGVLSRSVKAILRDLCRKGLNWDDRIPHEDLVRWQDWLKELPTLEQFAVKRCLKPTNFGRIVSRQLHNFSDASCHGEHI